MTLCGSKSQIIELSVPRIKIKGQADYSISRRFQEDHVTPLSDFSEIFDQDTKRPDEKSSTESNTIDDLIDATNSMNDSNGSTNSSDIDTTTGISTAASETELSTDFKEHQYATRSRKPLRNINKKNYESNNKYEQISDSINEVYTGKLHDSNAHNWKLLPDNKKRGANNRLQYNYQYHSGEGDSWQADDYNDELQINTIGSNNSKGNGGPYSGYKNWAGLHSDFQYGGNSDHNFLWDRAYSKSINRESDSYYRRVDDLHVSSSKIHGGSDISNYNIRGSYFGEHSSNYHEYIGENAYINYMRKSMAEHSGRTSSGGQSWAGDEHKWNNKRSRITFNRKNDNYNKRHYNKRKWSNNNKRLTLNSNPKKNYNKRNKISISSKNNNNKRGLHKWNDNKKRVLVKNNKSNNNGKSSRIGNTSELDKEKQKKKLSLFSINSFHTNNNINNNNNAEGAVNFNDVNNDKTLSNNIKSGQNNCFFIVCLGLYVNDVKFKN